MNKILLAGYVTLGVAWISPFARTWLQILLLLWALPLFAATLLLACDREPARPTYSQSEKALKILVFLTFLFAIVGYFLLDPDWGFLPVVIGAISADTLLRLSVLLAQTD